VVEVMVTVGLELELELMLELELEDPVEADLETIAWRER